MASRKLTPKVKTLRLWLQSETGLKDRPWSWRKAADHYYSLTGTRPSKDEVHKWRKSYIKNLIAAQPPIGTAEPPSAEAVPEISSEAKEPSSAPAAPEFPVEIVAASSSRARVSEAAPRLPVWEDPNAMAVSASKAGLVGLSKTIGAFEQDDYIKANAAGSIVFAASGVSSLAERQERIKMNVLRREALQRAVEGSVPQEDLLLILNELAAAAGGWDRLRVRAWWRQRQRALEGGGQQR